MIVQCAWCKRPLGTTPDAPRHAITHSICRYCKAGVRGGLRRQKIKATQKKRYAMRRSFEGNPHIPGQALEVRYRRGRSSYYKHSFSPGVRQRRLRPGEKFSHHSNAVVLYHPNRPVWEDDRTPGFWQRYGHGRGGSNPMARRKRGGMRFDLTTAALLAGVGYLIYTQLWAPMPAEATVSTGGQGILPQPAGTVWYNDPFQQSPDGMSGDQSFFIGSLPPGSAPPWRMASGTEIAAMNLGLAAGTIVAAGGGLIVHV